MALKYPQVTVITDDIVLSGDRSLDRILGEKLLIMVIRNESHPDVVFKMGEFVMISTSNRDLGNSVFAFLPSLV